MDGMGWDGLIVWCSAVLRTVRRTVRGGGTRGGGEGWQGGQGGAGEPAQNGNAKG